MNIESPIVTTSLDHAAIDAAGFCHHQTTIETFTALVARASAKRVGTTLTTASTLAI